MRGFSSKEVLLGLIVLAVVAAVLIPVAMNMQRKDLQEGDVQRMRRLYMALAIYESNTEGWLPPTLLAAREFAPDDFVFQSVGDPFVSPAEGGNERLYPVDGSMPDWELRSPIRISFAYLYSFAQAGKAEAKPWYEQKYDPKVGLIANEWMGSVEPGQPFQAQVSGQVLRLNTDGALFTLQRAGPKALGDADDLFFRR